MILTKNVSINYDIILVKDLAVEGILTSENINLIIEAYILKARHPVQLSWQAVEFLKEYNLVLTDRTKAMFHQELSASALTDDVLEIDSIIDMEEEHE